MKNYNDYISRTEVIKLIEDIKCNDDIPKNYGTLLDILRMIRRMPAIELLNELDYIPKDERLQGSIVIDD